MIDNNICIYKYNFFTLVNILLENQLFTKSVIMKKNRLFHLFLRIYYCKWSTLIFKAIILRSVVCELSY